MISERIQSDEDLLYWISTKRSKIPIEIYPTPPRNNGRRWFEYGEDERKVWFRFCLLDVGVAVVVIVVLWESNGAGEVNEVKIEGGNEEDINEVDLENKLGVGDDDGDDGVVREDDEKGDKYFLSIMA